MQIWPQNAISASGSRAPRPQLQGSGSGEGFRRWNPFPGLLAILFAAQQEAQRAQFLVEKAKQEQKQKIVQAEGEATAAKMISCFGRFCGMWLVSLTQSVTSDPCLGDCYKMIASSRSQFIILTPQLAGVWFV